MQEVHASFSFDAVLVASPYFPPQNHVARVSSSVEQEHSFFSRVALVVSFPLQEYVVPLHFWEAMKDVHSENDAVVCLEETDAEWIEWNESFQKKRIVVVEIW